MYKFIGKYVKLWYILLWNKMRLNRNEVKSVRTAIKIYLWYIKWEKIIYMIILVLKTLQIWNIWICICKCIYVNNCIEKVLKGYIYQPINNGHLWWGDQELKGWRRHFTLLSFLYCLIFFHHKGDFKKCGTMSRVI